MSKIIKPDLEENFDFSSLKVREDFSLKNKTIKNIQKRREVEVKKTNVKQETSE